MFVGYNIMVSKLVEQLIDTPIGQMLAIADDNYLYMLKFADQSKLTHYRMVVSKGLSAEIGVGTCPIIEQLKKELHDYFNGELKEFQTPTYLLGNDFQKIVWSALQEVPYGKTASYQEIAVNINKPRSARAIGNSNARNFLLILVPCHRIIRVDNTLGGYAAGIHRKQHLLALESNCLEESKALA
jgi:O-6-methylguanine DNA methyltransferase